MRCTGQEPALRLTGKEVCLGSLHTRRRSCRWASLLRRRPLAAWLSAFRLLLRQEAHQSGSVLQLPLDALKSVSACLCIPVPCDDFNETR